MPYATTRRITADADRAHTGPATWGQFAMDHCIRRASTMPGFFNLGSLVPLPPDRELSDVLEGIRRCVSALDVLRTHFTGAEYGLRQHVASSVTFTVAVVWLEGQDDPAADEVHEESRARPFDHHDAVQWRATVIRSAAGDHYLSFVVNHMLTDDYGWLILRDLLIRAITERTVSRPAWTAIEQAAFETSEEGRRVNRRALDRIGRLCRGIPTYKWTVWDGENVRYHVAKLTSPALPPVVSRLARRLDVSESTVLLSAYVSVVAEMLDTGLVMVNLLSSNRFIPRSADVISNMAWDAPALLQAEDDFGRQTRNAYVQAIDAYRHGFYHPLDAYAVLLGGIADDLYTLATGIHFNDGRHIRSYRPSGDASTRRRDLRLSTRPLEYVDAAVYLHVRDIGVDGLYQLELVCDTTIVPRSRMLTMLDAMETRILRGGV